MIECKSTFLHSLKPKISQIVQRIDSQLPFAAWVSNFLPFILCVTMQTRKLSLNIKADSYKMPQGCKDVSSTNLCDMSRIGSSLYSIFITTCSTCVIPNSSSICEHVDSSPPVRLCVTTSDP